MSRVRFVPARGTHRDRVQRAIRDGIEPAPELAARPVAERWLAGVAAFGDRDGARALALINDPSRRVRGIAFVVAPLACDDTQATGALRVAWSVRGERRLLRRMSRHGRTPAIDAFLDGLAADGQLRDLVDDLPFGSGAAVRRHLAHALERPSERFWAGLALGHCDVLAELLLARWRAHPGEADPVTRQLTDKHHARLAQRVPAAAAELAELLLSRGIEPAVAVWTELLRRRSAETIELAIRFEARVPAGILGSGRELPVEVLERVVAHAPHLLGRFWTELRKRTPELQRRIAEAWCDSAERFATWGVYVLRYLPAGDRRERAYERWSLAARDRDGTIGAQLLALLPIDLAAREARRQVREVVALQIEPWKRLSGIARYLPWPEAEAALRDHLGHPDGIMRGLALGELLANPGVYPDDAALPARALELVIARKFEQDPVRATMFRALAEWPRRVWQREHLPAVARALRDALDAADLSVATAALAEHLVVRLFGVDAEWAATWIATLIKERGQLHDANLGAKLSDTDLSRAAPQLVAIARTWATQERAPWLVAFANGLGARLPLVRGLGAIIAQARDATPHEWIATQLTETLARFEPERHAATLTAALARFFKRRWYGAIFAVARLDGVVGRRQPRERDRRRPTLLPALAETVAAVARLLDTRHTPPALAILRRRDPQTFDGVVAELVAADASVAVIGDVSRWLHRHRQDLLEPYLGERPIHGLWATGKTAWVMPWREGFFRWSPDQVERVAASYERVVADRTRDTPAVLATLSIWPAMEYASMDRLCALARDDRPPVQERAIRVLARCDAGQGVATLLDCLGDHRARFAIYGLRRALFNMLPDRALALLAAVPMTKVTVAKEVVRLTGELRAAGAFARLQELAAQRLHRDVRIALLRALWDHLDREPTWAVFDQAVADPDWVVASRLADIPANRLTRALDARLCVLLGRVIARPEPEARIALLGSAASLALVDADRTLLAACRERMRSPFDRETESAVAAVMQRSTEADMPALGAAFDALRDDPRSFHVAGAALCRFPIRSRASWRLAAEQLQAAAARDPRWSALAIQAAGVRARAADLAAALAVIPIDHDAAAAARAALAAIPDEEFEELAAGLAASARPEVRRIAVWALEHDARQGRGWTPPRLERLAALRRDASPEVAGAAARLWPPREQDPGFAPR